MMCDVLKFNRVIFVCQHEELNHLVKVVYFVCFSGESNECQRMEPAWAQESISSQVSLPTTHEERQTAKLRDAELLH